MYEEEYQQIKDTLHRLQVDSNSKIVFLVDKNGQQIPFFMMPSFSGGSDLRAFLGEYFQVDPRLFDQHLYEYADKEMIRHLFRVTASLDSMVVGEPQVLGQVKEAYAVARAVGAVSSQLDALVTRRFMAVFFPPAEFQVTTRFTEVSGHQFKTEGRILQNPGWLAVYGRAVGDETESDVEGCLSVPFLVGGVVLVSEDYRVARAEARDVVDVPMRVVADREGVAWPGRLRGSRRRALD